MIVHEVREALAAAGLETHPDFDEVWIDAPLSFVLRATDANEATPTVAAITQGGEGPTESPIPTYDTDPTYRVSRLQAANTPPRFIAPDCELSEIITTMMINTADTLVVRTGLRDIKGVVTSRGIGQRLALGQACKTANDALEIPPFARADDSLFSVIATISQKGYVLVRDQSQQVVGMLTTQDVAMQFRILSEPFLLLGEIENHLRRMISQSGFTKAELKEARDPGDSERDVNGVTDLTFGEYISLLSNRENWNKRLQFKVHRKVFIEHLDAIRRIRNDVMHFDPDGLAEEDLARLRDFVGFLQELEQIGILKPAVAKATAS